MLRIISKGLPPILHVQLPCYSLNRWSSHDVNTAAEEDEIQLTPEERKHKIQSILRSSLAVEGALLAYLKGQQFRISSEIDKQFFAEQEKEQADKIAKLLPQYRARPSIISPLLQKVGFGAGILSQVTPKWVPLVAAGAIQDAFSDFYADVVRQLTELEVDDKELREAMKQLRDVQRAPEGAPDPPDVTMIQNIQKIEELGYDGAMGVVVKMLCRSMFDVTKRI
eukprot:TRINITY_DN4310_c0_g1_i2.p2 TRINITY_DN4310_c0_g1~~TRINITY_DN4310_c0_g1_i2.p2  ORF type:complete len:224 (-),score=27.22 TRINITY_DN4310_c0_g1_i2:212-883(-)